MSDLWYLVAIMFGIQSDGKLDAYIFREPQKKPGFESKELCEFFVSDSASFILVKLKEHYGKRPIRQLLCVAQQDLRKFLKENEVI